jgi:hypothetical protein
MKQKVYLNPHVLAEMEVNIQTGIVVIQERELKSMTMNCLGRAQKCLVMWEGIPGTSYR